MGGRRDAGHFTQQLNIWRTVIKVIVADNTTNRFTTKLAIFFFVHTLENRALVPAHALIALERATKLLLGDAHHPNLQQFIGLRIVHQVMQAAPGAFQLLELLIVHDQVDLFGQLVIDLGDNCLNR